MIKLMIFDDNKNRQLQRLKHVCFFIIVIYISLFFISCTQKAQKPDKIRVIAKNRLCQIKLGKKKLLSGGILVYSNELKGKYKIQEKIAEKSQITGIWAKADYLENKGENNITGLSFEEIPGFSKGLVFWRNKPGNYRTKPIPINLLSDLEEDNIQLFLWQYTDNNYGAALPLSGNGFRATLGNFNGQFGVKVQSSSNSIHTNSIPLLAIGYGRDPYQLITDLYDQAFKWLGKEETNARNQKEGYFPFSDSGTYELPKVGVTTQVLQMVYNSLYFSPLIFSDFDMLQNHYPEAEFQALACTFNNRPVYITNSGKDQNADILGKITFPDGTSIRADSPLLPSEDCLFRFQGPKPFKTFTFSGNAGILLIYNLADMDQVKGTFKISDINSIQGKDFMLYNYFKQTVEITDRLKEFFVCLNRKEYELYYAIPFTHPIVPIGLISKYNAPKTIQSISYSKDKICVTVKGDGPLAFASTIRPKQITDNGKELEFSITGQLLIAQVPKAEKGIHIIDVFYNKEK